jgi:hypothetical protein
MLLESITRGSLPVGVTKGLIALPHKEGGRNTLNNWHPIMLLNVSYKIFAKTLQMKLQPVLMELISHDQSTFFPMRYILDNIFLTQETISHAKQSNQSLLFFKMDFSKAYDKVDLSFSFPALYALGFPALFIKMVRLMFENAVQLGCQLMASQQLHFPSSRAFGKGALWYCIFSLLSGKSSIFSFQAHRNSCRKHSSLRH